LQSIHDFMTKVLVRIQNLREEAGQTLVEYGLIVALISIVAIAALGFVGNDVTAVFNSVAEALKPGSSGGGGS
jgi:pilus assembly protein Flp/PilA